LDPSLDPIEKAHSISKALTTNVRKILELKWKVNYFRTIMMSLQRETKISFDYVIPTFVAIWKITFSKREHQNFYMSRVELGRLIYDFL